MNFQVPQFIEEKPKIIGFLTLGQFGYVAAAGLIAFAAFKILSFFLAFMISAIVVPLGIALAFFKVNGQPFPVVLLAALQYTWQPRVYTWQEELPQTTLYAGALEKIEILRKTMSIQEKLKAISFNVMTSKLLSHKTDNAQENTDRYQMVRYLTGERKLARRVDY